MSAESSPRDAVLPSPSSRDREWRRPAKSEERAAAALAEPRGHSRPSASGPTPRWVDELRERYPGSTATSCRRVGTNTSRSSWRSQALKDHERVAYATYFAGVRGHGLASRVS